MGFTDADGNPVAVPAQPEHGSHYAEIGDFQAEQYHRNAFAKGTAQEVDVLADVLGIGPGSVVLDVGCGNARHVRALRDRGIRAVGLDLSPAVLAGGRVAEVVAGRSEALPFADGSVDGILSVCQGGFGISPERDASALGEWCRVLRKAGRVAFTAFSLVFAARWMGPGEALDVDRGTHHHLADVRGADGARRQYDLWTAAYSAGHLRLMLQQAGFDVLGMAGVEPGGYQRHRAPTIADPELLIWAERR